MSVCWNISEEPGQVSFMRPRTAGWSPASGHGFGAPEGVGTSRVIAPLVLGVLLVDPDTEAVQSSVPSEA